ncbi:hypothetical protein LHJ74_14435 [Streptomyces sp. N2-109]|uniref:Uncharacterized protein n=1 Tax=Streptomyces gossypii TaxID=2883101 RepID=A0ABT2JTB9_9ACTN|nr:hypothetical protein [Streptomyces gossypii]MCT2591091.1 hypothetical protein [Streptomyces gossypii]
MTGPEHYRAAERLLSDASFAAHPQGRPVRRSGGEYGPGEHAALIAQAQVHATLALATQTSAALSLDAEPPIAYVYRASWGMTPLGTYANPAAAREHCEADARNNDPEYDGGIFGWLGDESEPDDPDELLVTVNGVERTTEYTVTRITIASAYDPEADS